MGHTHKTSYLLTKDVAHLEVILEPVGLSVNPATLQALDARLEERLRNALTGYNLESIELRDLAKEVRTLTAQSQKDHPDAVIVSTNPLLCQWPNCPVTDRFCCLDINRIVNHDGESLGRGPRPWNKPIKQQLDRLAERLEGKPIILLEDGSFSGETVADIVGQCRHLDIEVSDVICGIVFEKGLPVIKDALKKYPQFVRKEDECLDWMPDHDFFPYFPSCGKIVGENINGHLVPINHIGLSISIPYILPYGDIVGWASIPEDHAVNFSLECLGDTIDFFSELERINGPVLDSHTKEMYPRASVPHSTKRERLTFLKPRRIVEVLSGDYNRLKESQS